MMIITMVGDDNDGDNGDYNDDDMMVRMIMKM